MKNPALAYRQFSVQGATPLRLVVMLYDGAIAALQRAIAAIQAHDISNKCAELNRATAIIAQLEGSLNFEKGGEVARTLKSLYVYARSQALKGNLENSAPTLLSLVDRLTSVREAWAEADRLPPEPPTVAMGDNGASRPAAQRSRPFYPEATEAEDGDYPPSADRQPSSWRVSA
jgi:flagellar secretion chaperone FliS